MRPQRRLAPLIIATACLAGCASPARRDSTPGAAQGELRFSLPSGKQVYVPGTLPAHAAAPDLLVHFHGAAGVVQREFAASGATAVLVTVNYPGLSSAYETPLREPGRFAVILDETLAELVQRGRVTKAARWRRVCVSSFSAGYGAVRAILNCPEYFERVDGIFLADSLYAGYVDENGAKSVNAENMAAFRRFAAEAAAGRKFLLITHSYLEPGRYAGTHETADDLIRHVGATRTLADEWIPADTQSGSLHVISRVDVGSLHVRGCAGTTGEDHMAHLRRMRWGLARLPTERPP